MQQQIYPALEGALPSGGYYAPVFVERGDCREGTQKTCEIRHREDAVLFLRGLQGKVKPEVREPDFKPLQPNHSTFPRSSPGQSERCEGYAFGIVKTAISASAS